MVKYGKMSGNYKINLDFTPSVSKNKCDDSEKRILSFTSKKGVNFLEIVTILILIQ